MNILLVMAGGAFGSMLRYGIGLFIMKRIPQPPIPFAMLLVNVIGSFGLGMFLGSYFSVTEAATLYNTPFYLFIGLGFFGAFTTFSTFSVETVELLREREFKKACIYVLLTVFLSVLLFAFGISLSTW